MKRVSVFDWYSRTGDDKVEWAIAYYDITNAEYEEVQDGAFPPIPEYEENTGVVEWELIEDVLAE